MHSPLQGRLSSAGDYGAGKGGPKVPLGEREKEGQICQAEVLLPLRKVQAVHLVAGPGWPCEPQCRKMDRTLERLFGGETQKVTSGKANELDSEAPASLAGCDRGQGMQRGILWEKGEHSLHFIGRNCEMRSFGRQMKNMFFIAGFQGPFKDESAELQVSYAACAERRKRENLKNGLENGWIQSLLTSF